MIRLGSLVFLLAALGSCASEVDLPVYDRSVRDPAAEVTRPTDILDANGDVVGAGWARRPLFRFDPNAVPESRREHVRAWDFYEVYADGFTVAFTLARLSVQSVGIVILANVKVDDYAAKRQYSAGPTIFGNPDAVVLDPTPGGTYRVENGGDVFSYGRGERGRVIDFDLGPAGSSHMSGHVELDDPPGDSVAVVTPFADRGHFFYENKVTAMRSRGFVQVGTHRWDLQDGEPHGTMDWVRAVVPPTIEWTWATAQGTSGGHVVGINMGTVFGDETRGNPNAVVVDGHLSPLGRLEWTYDLADPESPWSMRSADGRVSLRLRGTNDYVEKISVDLGFYATQLVKLDGTWDGSITLEDGTRLDVAGLNGAAEWSTTTW